MSLAPLALTSLRSLRLCFLCAFAFPLASLALPSTDLHRFTPIEEKPQKTQKFAENTEKTFFLASFVPLAPLSTDWHRFTPIEEKPQKTQKFTENTEKICVICGFCPWRPSCPWRPWRPSANPKSLIFSSVLICVICGLFYPWRPYHPPIYTDVRFLFENTSSSHIAENFGRMLAESTGEGIDSSPSPQVSPAI